MEYKYEYKYDSTTKLRKGHTRTDYVQQKISALECATFRSILTL